MVIATLVTRTITNVKGMPGGVATGGEPLALHPRRLGCPVQPRLLLLPALSGVQGLSLS